MSRHIIIVGGVAGGMSCAARIKRLDDSIHVTVFERGPDVSFANCGMPYYIGGVIQDRASMLMQTPQGLQNRYGLDIRTRHEVIRIDRETKQVEVKNLDTNEVFTESYSDLVLAPGASPIRPPIPGAERDRPADATPVVRVLNNLADMDAIAEAAKTARQACVVGAGFIGLELVENLREKGIEVTLVEMLDQVMPPLDWEMTQPLLQELRLNGVAVYLKDSATAITPDGVTLKSGLTIPSDLVCLCVGVRPNSELAKEAGLELGPRGHIKVDAHLRTNDPHIYAVGDAIETRDHITWQPTTVPLAGPANRQGRIVADILCGNEAAYQDTLGVAIVKVFGLAAASAGMSEKRLKQAGLEYRRVFIHPTQRPRYYPGATPMGVKILFNPEGKLMGAQVVGPEGVENVINILATAMQSHMTVDDLEHLELAYSPQWGSAKHAVNMAGFVASNVLKGDVDLIEPEQSLADGIWLDVRMPSETEGGMLPGAINIPVDELRTRHKELPRNKRIAIYCAVGMRGYIAARFLKQQGYEVSNLNGGYRTWAWYQTKQTEDKPVSSKKEEAPMQTSEPPIEPTNSTPVDTIKLDCSGLQCPGPLVKIRETVNAMQPGQIVEVTASDPGFAADIPSWCKHTGNTLISVQSKEGRYIAQVQKTANASTAAESSCLISSINTNKKSFVCFSGDLDKVMATFVIANGAAAMGNEVTIFFTFWGLNVLRKDNPPTVEKGFLDKMFGMMMPRGASRLKLSQMNMGGMGTLMMKYVMKSKNVMSLEELMQTARSSGVRLIACSMSMDVMGLKKEELIDGIEIAGVGNFLGNADESNMTLFI